MAKNGLFCSDNFSQKNWYKFGKKCLFQSFSDNFSQKDWYKFGMEKMAIPYYFPTIFLKKTGTNLEWPKMAILNFFQQFFPEGLV